MADKGFVTIDGMNVPIENERNLLELVRKAGIDLPTFCYHSELSVYGACRMCVVEADKMGVVTSCTVPPQAGMVVKTNTEKLRKIRKTIIELLLANHDRDCTTCDKSGACKLQSLSDRLGVSKVRFGHEDGRFPIDSSTPAIVRDPNKCILCGDCVRVCGEVQGVGILDFAHRGSRSMVMPAFGKNLGDVDCVQCGQCATVCPTGALTIKSNTDQVWKAIHDPKIKVIAQVAPAVRVSLAEEFGHAPGEIVTGKIVSALKKIGVDQVFDTSFTADLTVIEEASEFLERLGKGENLPQFTSCCPAWVKYAEQYHPDLLDSLSSCRSPQQMFGSLAKRYLAKEMGIDSKDLFVVSVMPCVAKKFEAGREEFEEDYGRDVDAVITTKELARMIKEAGLDFERLEVEPFDIPMGLATGAGMIFGNTGGVSEAVLRSAASLLGAKDIGKLNFEEVRGMDGIRETSVNVAGHELKLAVAHSLGAAAELLKAVKSGEKQYHLIEIMACPGGCIGGGGQPSPGHLEIRKKRAKALYDVDKLQMLRRAHENPYVKALYDRWLEKPGSHEAHHALHTEYGNRRRIADESIKLSVGEGKKPGSLDVAVCVGTCCYLKGSYDLLHKLIDKVAEHGLEDKVNLGATFCFERCEASPNMMIGGELISKIGQDDVDRVFEDQILKRLVKESRG